MNDHIGINWIIPCDIWRIYCDQFNPKAPRIGLPVHTPHPTAGQLHSGSCNEPHILTDRLRSPSIRLSRFYCKSHGTRARTEIMNRLNIAIGNQFEAPRPRFRCQVSESALLNQSQALNHRNRSPQDMQEARQPSTADSKPALNFTSQ